MADNEFYKWAAEYMGVQWADRGMPQSVYQDYCWAAHNLCESPIERQMLAKLIFVDFGYYNDINVVVRPDDFCGGWNFKADAAYIVPQYQPAGLNYRLDFLVVLNPRGDGKAPMFGVECDGHDFHEKTKQQAAHDKRRDRMILAAGIPTFRFTGSEVFNSLDECGDELNSFGHRALNTLWGLE